MLESQYPSRRESTMVSPGASNPTSACNTLTSITGPPLLLVEAAMTAMGEWDSKSTRDTIGREVGAGVTADVGGVGLMLEVSGAQGGPMLCTRGMGISQQHSRAQSPDKDELWEPVVRQR